MRWFPALLILFIGLVTLAWAVSQSFQISVTSQNFKIIGPSGNAVFSIDTSGLLSVANLNLSGKKSCGKLYTDAQGNVLCGVDQKGITSESDPQVGATTRGNVCYGTGTQVTCADSAFKYDASTDTLSVKYVEGEGVRIQGLRSCSTLSTDAQGNVRCGVSQTGGNTGNISCSIQCNLEYSYCDTTPNEYSNYYLQYTCSSSYDFALGSCTTAGLDGCTLVAEGHKIWNNKIVVDPKSWACGAHNCAVCMDVLCCKIVCS